MTDEEIRDEANALAHDFYLLMGGKTRRGHRFDLGRSPQERLCWQLALVAFDRLRGIDVEYVVQKSRKGDRHEPDSQASPPIAP